MPEVDLAIGARSYRVVCDPGEEAALHEAAALLSAQAGTVEAAGQMPESRTLLLAGLLLANQMREQNAAMAAQSEKMRAVEMRAERAEAAAANPAPAPLLDDGERSAKELLEQIALELEALADDLEAPEE